MEDSGMDFVDLGVNLVDLGMNFVDLQMGFGDLGMDSEMGFAGLEMDFMDGKHLGYFHDWFIPYTERDFRPPSYSPSVYHVFFERELTFIIFGEESEHRIDLRRLLLDLKLPKNFAKIVGTVASFGGSNIDLSTWEDKKNPSESRFPAQVSKMKKEMKTLT
ncbi:hypothetical protein T459_03856 [Capsicum annuum]|uniref:Uncharacterized protein n=1 Tax=Capsicum annuum TaxID=4072 RepID=A0A2G3AP17_CAPAN|nr:hypothetical protein T459_03856 [Capsicum annuum]